MSMSEEDLARVVEAGGWALCARAGGAGRGKCDPAECSCHNEALDVITAALPIIERAFDPGWQDIATVPPGVDEVLGYQATPGDHENRMAICRRHAHTFWIGDHGLMPTHWRPLPSPPALADEVSG